MQRWIIVYIFQSLVNWRHKLVSPYLWVCPVGAAVVAHDHSLPEEGRLLDSAWSRARLLQCWPQRLQCLRWIWRLQIKMQRWIIVYIFQSLVNWRHKLVSPYLWVCPVGSAVVAHDHNLPEAIESKCNPHDCICAGRSHASTHGSPNIGAHTETAANCRRDREAGLPHSLGWTRSTSQACNIFLYVPC